MIESLGIAAAISGGKSLLSWLAQVGDGSGAASDAASIAAQVVIGVLGNAVSFNIEGIIDRPAPRNPADRELNHHIEQAYVLAETASLVQFVKQFGQHPQTRGDSYAGVAKFFGLDQLARRYRAVERKASAADLGDLTIQHLATALVSVNDDGWQSLKPAVRALREQCESRALAALEKAVGAAPSPEFVEIFRNGLTDLPAWYALLTHNFAAVLLEDRYAKAKESLLLRLVSRTALSIVPNSAEAEQVQVDRALQSELSRSGDDLSRQILAAIEGAGSSLGSTLREVRDDLRGLIKSSEVIGQQWEQLGNRLQVMLVAQGELLHDIKGHLKELLDTQRGQAVARPAGSVLEVPWVDVDLGRVPFAPEAPIGRATELAHVTAFLRTHTASVLGLVGRSGSGKTSLLAHALLRPSESVVANDKWPPAVIFERVKEGDRQMVPAILAALDRLLVSLGHARVVTNSQFSTLAAKLNRISQLLLSSRVEVVLVLDSLEGALDPNTGQLFDDELDELLTGVLDHVWPGLRIVFTSQVIPTVSVDGLRRPLVAAAFTTLKLVDLGIGLEQDHGIELLRSHDAGGDLGLLNAPQTLLRSLCGAVGGNPNAIKHLALILANDRTLTPASLLEQVRAESPQHPGILQLLALLIGKHFRRLPPVEQEILRATAIYGGQASHLAIAAVVDANTDAIAASIQMLLRGQLLRLNQGEYAIHDSERAYYLSQLGDAELKHISLRAADYWASASTASEDWSNYYDALATLSEIRQRGRAGELERASELRLNAARHLYDLGLLSAATRLLLEASSDEQQLPAEVSRLSQLALCHWKAGEFSSGQAAASRGFMIAAARRDPVEKEVSARLRRTEIACVLELGDVHQAIERYSTLLEEIDQLLTLDKDDIPLGRLGAEVCLDLAFAESMAGRILPAIQHGRRSVTMCEVSGKRPAQPRLQAMAMAYLATYLTYVEQDAEALQMYQQSILLAIRTEARYELAIALGLAAEQELLRDNSDRALSMALTALGIETDTDAISGSWCNYLIAQDLSRSPARLADAHGYAEIACRFTRPLNDANPRVLLGILALCRGMRDDGVKHLQQALRDTDRLVRSCPQNWEAWVAGGWALLGLASQGLAPADAAFESYGRARDASPHRGHLSRIRYHLAISSPLIPDLPAVLSRIASLYDEVEV